MWSSDGDGIVIAFYDIEMRLHMSIIDLTSRKIFDLSGYFSEDFNGIVEGWLSQ